MNGCSLVLEPKHHNSAVVRSDFCCRFSWRISFCKPFSILLWPCKHNFKHFSTAVNQQQKLNHLFAKNLKILKTIFCMHLHYKSICYGNQWFMTHVCQMWGDVFSRFKSPLLVNALPLLIYFSQTYLYQVTKKSNT